MRWVIDTNILLRLTEPSHAMHANALAATSALLGAGETVHTLTQNIAEFWNVCTRPLDKNGLGLTPAQTDAEVRRVEVLFPVLPDTANIYTEWRRVVVKHAVSGVQVHDARIAAAMLAHGVTHLLTFNAQDFKHYTSITAMTPAEVTKSYPPQPAS